MYSQVLTNVNIVNQEPQETNCDHSRRKWLRRFGLDKGVRVRPRKAITLRWLWPTVCTLARQKASGRSRQWSPAVQKWNRAVVEEIYRGAFRMALQERILA